MDLLIFFISDIIEETLDLILGKILNFVIKVAMVTKENSHYNEISKETFYSESKNDLDTIFGANVHHICKNNLIERNFGFTFVFR